MITITPRAYANITTPIVYKETLVKLTTTWNSREQAWYLSISNSKDDLLVSGFKMSQTANVTARSAIPYFELFDVYIINDKINQERPTFDDMGKNLRLAFIDKEETALLLSSFPNSAIYK